MPHCRSRVSTLSLLFRSVIGSYASYAPRRLLCRLLLKLGRQHGHTYQLRYCSLFGKRNAHNVFELSHVQICFVFEPPLPLSRYVYLRAPPSRRIRHRR